VLGVAGVQVHDRGAGLRRPDRRFRDLLRRDRQVGRHRRRVDRAGDGAGDDDLVGCRHGTFLLSGVSGWAAPARRPGPPLWLAAFEISFWRLTALSYGGKCAMPGPGSMFSKNL